MKIMKIRAATCNWRELRFANMSSNDSQKFLCPFRMDWATLRFNRFKISYLFWQFSHTVFGIQRTKMCVFICLPFGFFFFSLSLVFLHSLDFFGPYRFYWQMCIAFDGRASKRLHQKSNRLFNRIYLASSVHIVTRFESNNTMKMST